METHVPRNRTWTLPKVKVRVIEPDRLTRVNQNADIRWGSSGGTWIGKTKQNEA
jgi:hypothetical protein